MEELSVTVNPSELKSANDQLEEMATDEHVA